MTSTSDDGLSAFMNVRPRLFGIAYRLLRSAAEAEDLVQDVWVRWQTADRSVVRDAAAFLATTTRRLALNVIQSARSRHETPLEPGLPEAVDSSADPEAGTERNEALEFAVLILRKELTPRQRTAYVLREAFECSYREIADVLRLEVANTRQLVTRARQHIAASRRMNVGPSPGLSQDGPPPGLVQHRRFTVVRRLDTERNIDHEARHHRRHRTHRIEAREQVA